MTVGLESFKSLTGMDIEPFLRESSRFLSTDYSSILDFYSGDVKSVEPKVLKSFENLKFTLREVFEAFQRNRGSMFHSFYWELLETVEEIDSKLEYLDNADRWSRASITDTGYTNLIRKQHTLKQNQTLENVAEEYYGTANISDWTKIAQTNHLSEEDYSQEGGNNLIIELDQLITTNLKVDSVVDILYGKSVYGKDIYKKLQFVSDDLNVLDYDHTLNQSVDILINLKRNSNPDFPELGLQSQTIIGTNRSILNFPIITRDLKNCFSTDDSLKDFQLVSLTREQDNTSLTFKVYTRLNELLELTRTV